MSLVYSLQRFTFLACLGVCVASLILPSQTIAQPSAAPALHPASVEGMPPLKTRGGGLLRMYGFQIYNAFLWTPDGAAFDRSKPYVLDIEYLRNFAGKALAEESIKQMRGQGIGSDAVYPKWLAEMNRVFPNVAPNDRLTGVATAQRTTRFFHNGKLTGEVNDPDFTDAFFGIWLNEKSSQRRFRDRLLGNAQ
jgi:Chalcone isomerase-like